MSGALARSIKRQSAPGAMSRPRGITLSPIGEGLTEALVQDQWFEDETTNRLSGFGLGDDGRLAALETFAGVARGDVPATGIYRRGTPVGFIAWLPRDAEGRRVSVHIHLAPIARGYGVGSAALSQWLSIAFKDGIYRVESEVLAINKAAIRGLRHMGFRREARLTSALYMDENYYDLILLRMLRKDWRAP